MTIEVRKREECRQQEITEVTRGLRRLPWDELPGVSRELAVSSLDHSLAEAGSDQGISIWLAFENNVPIGLALLRSLAWDSEILGVTCASLELYLSECDQPSRQAAASLLIHHAMLQARLEDTRFISTKVRSDQFAKVHALEDSGFRLMDTEMVLRYWSCEINSPAPETLTFSQNNNEKVEELATMGQLFHMSRFFADPRIDNEKAKRLWQSSVKDSCGGYASGFMVAEAAQKPLGFVTFMDEPNVGGAGGPSVRSFFHVGVSTEAQGQGVGTALIQQAVAASEGFDHIVVETQSRNAAALALYQKCGFRVVDSRFAFHLWLA